MITKTIRILFIGISIGFILGMTIVYIELDRSYSRIIDEYRNEMYYLAFPARAEPPCIVQGKFLISHNLCFPDHSINDLQDIGKGD